MSLNNHCPVQSSIDSHCQALGEDEAIDQMVEQCKEQLMKDLSPETIVEALREVPDNDPLWQDIIRSTQSINRSNNVYLDNAGKVVRGLFSAIESHIEKQAQQQIDDELGGKDTWHPLDDGEDDDDRDYGYW